MANLFGVDIAQEIANAFSGQLVEGILHKRTPGTRTAGQLTAGTNPSNSDHTFDGVATVKEVRRAGQVGSDMSVVITIIGKSVRPFVVPEVNDRVTMESITYTLSELVKRDPASAAYVFIAE